MQNEAKARPKQLPGLVNSLQSVLAQARQAKALVEERTLKCAFGVPLDDNERSRLHVHDAIQLRTTRHAEIYQTAAWPG